jgi:hypothetical protein
MILNQNPIREHLNCLRDRPVFVRGGGLGRPVPGVRSLGPLLSDRRRRLHRMDRLRIHLLQDVSF